ncbi:glycosyltransferase family 4 protein [Nocardioides sp. GXQ0305]|uniref:glycosyltransferase family 4 protein n=1 Tax=Nocardioides sp. GXQ0305 TaxID=3423912 RepID=UPI003D7EE95D
MSVGRVVVVAPEGLADPRRPSGGNTYDLRLCGALAASGWSVDLRQVGGGWPQADAASRRHVAEALAEVPDGAVVLVDGLVALAAPEVLVPAGRRLRTVVLVHMPLGHPSDGAVLRSATGVLATSGWTRRLLLARHGLDPGRVHVAAPGVDAAPRATGSRDGGVLLSVGAVVPAKGQDLLVAALARASDLAWRWVCAGSLDRDPAFVARLRRDLEAAGLHERVELPGLLAGDRLAAAYAGADLLVHPSRAETYGMVVTEALARGVPVVGTQVGGVDEALGATSDGVRPGRLTPGDDVGALAASLRAWLTDPGLRRRWRTAAAQRRAGLAGWADTGDRVARVLDGVAA